MLMLAIAGAMQRDAVAVELILEPRMRHLRNAEPREWTEFPEKAEATDLTYTFEVTETFRPQTLRLRHRDLRRDWIISLDGQLLIRVPQGDQDATTFWPLPAEKLRPGKHELKIATKDKTPDDVMFGELRLDTRTKAEMLGEATVEVEVTSPKTGTFAGGAIPCRLTIVDKRGTLMTTGIEPESRLAIRPGVIYTLDGKAKFTVPAGKYVLYASRGFEYSVAEMKLELKAGEVVRPKLTITKEVNLWWHSCDTHVHTVTHSGHGDCTAAERLVTLAGEGLEMAIATDHNKTVYYNANGDKPGWTTIGRLKSGGKIEPAFETYLISGSELTTKIGHFNVFPLDPTKPPLDSSATTWTDIGATIEKVGGNPIVILNHARDVHNGFRPFAPERHISVAGEDVAGWELPANAMEVVNSGSTQSDPWQLFHDWFGLLNRGRSITPIGSSDSHDVARYIVGQGRTYLSSSDDGTYDDGLGPIRDGNVLCAMGLLCETSINGSSQELQIANADSYRVEVNVLGPSWVQADEIRLFVNGAETEVARPLEKKKQEIDGVRCSVAWTLPKLKHDVHVVALAKGPGVDAPYWPIAKPYQPTSPDWKSYVIGCSGAIRIDGDGDGKYSSPYDYAKKLFADSAGDDAKLVAALKDYDEAVAVQTASVARAAGRERFDSFLAAIAEDGAPQTKTGANNYVAGWRATLVGATGAASQAPARGEKK